MTTKRKQTTRREFDKKNDNKTTAKETEKKSVEKSNKHICKQNACIYYADTKPARCPVCKNLT